MPLAANGGNLLEGICDTHEAWPAPRDMMATIREGAVVVATTHAEAHAVHIETHQWQQHQIEPSCLDGLGAMRLDDAEVIDGLACSCHRFDELHADGSCVDA